MLMTSISFDPVREAASGDGWRLDLIANEEVTAPTSTYYATYTGARNAQKAAFQADPGLNTVLEGMAADQVLSQWPVPVAQVADDLRRAEGLGPRSSDLPGFDVAAYDPAKWWTAPPGDALSILRSEETVLFLDAEAATPNVSGAVLTNLATGATNVSSTSKDVLKPEDRGYVWFPGESGGNVNYLSHEAVTGTADTSTEWRVRLRRPPAGNGARRALNGFVYVDIDDTTLSVTIAAYEAGGVFFPNTFITWASTGVAIGQWVDIGGWFNPSDKTLRLYVRTSLPSSLGDSGGLVLKSEAAYPTVTGNHAISGSLLLGGSDFGTTFRGSIGAWWVRQNGVTLVDVNASTFTNHAATSVVCPNGKTVTVYRGTTEQVTTIVPSRANGGRAVVALKSDQVISTPHHASLNFDASTSMTIITAFRINHDYESYGHPYTKWTGVYPAPWIRTYRIENSLNLAGTVFDGVSGTDSYYGVGASSPVVHRQTHTLGIRADRARGLWHPFMDSFIPAASPSLATIGDCSNTADVNVDVLSDIAAVATIRRALSDAELVAVGAALREGKERPYRRGQKFEVTTAGFFKGHTLEPGDLLIAATAGTVDTAVWHRVPAADRPGYVPSYGAPLMIMADSGDPDDVQVLTIDGGGPFDESSGSVIDGGGV
jgi:hypothetical protein